MLTFRIMQVLVFVHETTPRVEYIFHHILTNMMGIPIEITSRIDFFEHYAGPKIAYANTNFNSSTNITPNGLLSQKDVSEQNITMSKWRGMPIFFGTGTNGDIPFDLFAASFYLISRYEEYLPFEPDKHSRFCHNHSLAYRNNFLKIPLVDLWVKEFSAIFSSKFPKVKIKKTTFRYTPSIDIDNAFAYKHKGFMYALLATGKALITGRLKEFNERILVHLNLKNDPYNSYSKLFDILADKKHAIWFILGGSKSKYDRNIALNRKSMKNLVQKISERYTVGVHPSYQSYGKPVQIQKEIKAIENCCNQPVTRSRQHFLRLTLPQTYQHLAQLGITQDYTMGYSKTIGFRASTCTPFKFYDLECEKELTLAIIPFQVMDRALLSGEKLNPKTAVAETLRMARTVKNVGGHFVTIWHNESLSDAREWKGWSNVFKEIVNGI
ncbi:MAG: polysaccharide deacetylase family protein [Bacteroidales bacterium]|nr:polysaccharide deacetylase family protein [Bacteroidales bacterium]MDD4673717.1 polysaccharide deacetylase family protein [Bacteroidales bacterium]MDY0348998.1 polysaccharide deacetylase family protein [Tenuifilaceae bacterium]